MQDTTLSANVHWLVGGITASIGFVIGSFAGPLGGIILAAFTAITGLVCTYAIERWRKANASEASESIAISTEQVLETKHREFAPYVVGALFAVVMTMIFSALGMLVLGSGGALLFGLLAAVTAAPLAAVVAEKANKISAPSRIVTALGMVVGGKLFGATGMSFAMAEYGMSMGPLGMLVGATIGAGAGLVLTPMIISLGEKMWPAKLKLQPQTRVNMGIGALAGAIVGVSIGNLVGPVGVFVIGSLTGFSSAVLTAVITALGSQCHSNPVRIKQVLSAISAVGGANAGEALGGLISPSGKAVGAVVGVTTFPLVVRVLLPLGMRIGLLRNDKLMPDNTNPVQESFEGTPLQNMVSQLNTTAEAVETQLIDPSSYEAVFNSTQQVEEGKQLKIPQQYLTGRFI